MKMLLTCLKHKCSQMRSGLKVLFTLNSVLFTDYPIQEVVAGNHMKLTVTLNITGNIWDDARTKLNKRN